MKWYSRKRTGQSGGKLTLALALSFFFHVVVALAAVFLYSKATPKILIPLSYQVMLVGQPMDVPQVSPEEAPPGPPKQEPQKKTKTAPKAKKTKPSKSALPGFSLQKKEPLREQPKPAETETRKEQAAPAASVMVSAPQMDDKFSWYLGLLRGRIELNWKPTPDVKDAKARILFTVNRSGWVTDVNIDADHSKGTFEFKQAAIRAIRASNPFPPLPEDFPRYSLDFSVDLVQKQ